MENFYLYVGKVSGLLTALYLAYYFLLRKETFFIANRWYLIFGLFTSVLLPFYTYTKIIYVDPQPENYIVDDRFYTVSVQEPPSFDWFHIITYLYVLISVLLLIKVIINLSSVILLLSKKEKCKKDAFSMVNLTENLAPFSFFNYIAINPDLYTQEDFECILQHEKVHSSEKHSADILLANLFSAFFWFNPFVWLYKKAIVQNLEYIADQKAIQYCSNKTTYQKALLRVVTNQNYLSTTNHFNQSLIKKRIVMLNANKSEKQNSVKYLFVIPILISFVVFFQMRVIAQEKSTVSSINQSLDEIIVRLEINKHTSDAEMKKEKEVFKKEFDTDLKFSKIKRNTKGEITSIKVDLKASKGKSETCQFSGTKPIKSFTIFVTKDNNGIVSIGYGKPERKKVFNNNKKVVVISGDEDTFDLNFEIPEISDFQDEDFSSIPEVPSNPNDSEKMVIIKKIKDEKGKTKVILNGEVVLDNDEIISHIENDNGFNYSFGWDSDDENVVISKENIHKLRREALEKVKAEIAQIKPELEKSRIHIIQSMDDFEWSKSAIENSKKEIELAKKELEKARSELEKARIDLEKKHRKNNNS